MRAEEIHAVFAPHPTGRPNGNPCDTVFNRSRTRYSGLNPDCYDDSGSDAAGAIMTTSVGLAAVSSDSSIAEPSRLLPFAFARHFGVLLLASS
ncbi:MAG: hypothetical protein ACKOBM_05680, partial [Gammaproteobacteria bacterium]